MEGAGRARIYAPGARPETRLKPPRRIGVFGHVGNGNLGDEVIIAAVILGIRARIPDAALSGYTIRPEDTRARHGIPAFPIRRGSRAPDPGRPASAPLPTSPSVSPFAGLPSDGGSRGSLRGALRRVPGLYGALSAVRNGARLLGEVIAEIAFWGTRLRRMRELDLLIVAGSNQLSDYVGGPWSFPYTVFAWAAAARATGVRVAFLSVGAGPIRDPLSRWFIKTALGWSSFRSFRDLGSREAVEALGIAGPHVVAPDLAHGFPIGAATEPAAAARGGPTLVINPLPYFDPRFWAESDAGVYARYVETLARFATIQRERGRRVRFVPTQLRADPPVIADIVRAMGLRAGDGDPDDRVDPPVATLEDLVGALRGADFVIATRFHGVVLGQMAGAPVLGIAYRRSTTDLLVDVGQGAYSIPIADLTLERLLERFEALEGDTGAAARIRERLALYRASLEGQYDSLLGTARGEG